jgi:hypothetical protein
MATVNLSPLFNGQTMFNGALPLAGGQIYCYQAGSSTPLTTYTTSSGNIANSNPVILGSTGKLPSEMWLQAGYSYKFVLQDASNVVINTYDNIAGILTTVPTSNATLPAGCIIIWSGSTGSIPSGFVICDGSNGTPDLRNSFVLGAGNNYTVGQTGGSTDAIVVSHTHTATSTSTVTDPGHFHNTYGAYGGGGNPGGSLNINNPGGQNQSVTTATTGITVATATTNASAGTSGTNANMPPYYALAYIMKT